jgi:hypothetical protein
MQAATSPEPAEAGDSTHVPESWRGRPLDRVEAQRTFPEKSKGIVFGADGVKYIKMLYQVRKSQAARYCNYFLSEDSLLYQSSTNIDANRHMRALVGAPRTVPVHLVLDSKDYLYGQVRVEREVEYEDRQCFVLRRVAPAGSASPPPPAGSASPPPPAASAPPAKRPRHEFVYRDHNFDSDLECKHASFFDALGLAWTPHPVTANSLECADGRVVEYTPDFQLQELGVEPLPGTHRVILEIKPRRPHEQEWERVERFAAFTGYHVVLLYGDLAAGLPHQPEDASGRHYRHHNAVRGMLWEGGTGRLLAEDLVWGVDGATERPMLTQRRLLADRRWDHPRLHEAYAAAARTSGRRQLPE